LKTISFWASRHPRTTILLIIILHLIAGINALVLGIFLSIQEWIAPRWLVLVFAHLFFLAYVLYPSRSASRWSLSYSYPRQKALDFTLVFAASLTIIFGLSRLWVSVPVETTLPTASFISYEPDGKKLIESNKRVAKLKLRTKIKQARKQIRKNLGEIRQALKKQQTRSKRNWTRFLLIVFGSAIVLGLALLLAAFSCSIACSGQEGLSLVVLILGLGALAWLVVIGIKAMDRKYPIILKEEEGPSEENLN
jgi:hypothetical protein